MRDAGIAVFFFFVLTNFGSAQDRPFLELEAGGGYVVGGGGEDPGPCGEFADLMYLKALERQGEAVTSFNGFALEAFVGRRFTPLFGLKGGVTHDFNFETDNFQPVVLASFGF